MSTRHRTPPGTPAPGGQPPKLARSTPLLALTFFVAFLASAETGHWLSFHDEQFGLEFATFWPPSGLYVAALLLNPRRRWPALVAAASLANLISDVSLHGVSPRLSAWFCVVNLVEAYVSATLVRRFAGRFSFRDVREVLLFAALSAGAGAAVAAGLGGAALMATYGGDFSIAFGVWWSSATIGHLIVAPAVFALVDRARRLRRGRVRPIRMAEGTFLAVLLAGLAELVFGHQSLPIAFSVFPLMILAALRSELAGVAISTTVLSVVTILETAAGHGPFGLERSIPERVMLTQSLLSLAAFSSLVVAGVVKERRRAAEVLEESEARFRDLFENMSDLVQSVAPDGRIVGANRAWKRVLGYDDAELARIRLLDVVHPDDREHCAAVFERVLAGEDVGRFGTRFLARNGRVIEVDGTSRRRLEGNRVVFTQTVLRDVSEERAQRRELERARNELELANHDLRRLAATDALTGLNNRGAFEEHLVRELSRAFRYSTELSLVLLDVDQFKLFNDRFGHSAGDDVLRTVARLIRAAARGTDFVARFGGEEFVVLLPHCSARGAFAQAERFRQVIAGWPWPARPITVSVGVATTNPELLDAAMLVRLADEALYRAKQSGRNQVRQARGTALSGGEPITSGS